MKNNHTVTIAQHLCIGCRLCVKDCPSSALALKNSISTVIKQDCIKCGHCVAICPTNAVSMSGFEDAPQPLTPDMKVDAGALLGQLKARRSMRHFTAQDVSAEIIEQIIEAGRYTPSGSNKQTVSYVVLRKNIHEYEQIAVSLFRRLKKTADLFTGKYRDTEIDDDFLFKKAPVAIVIKSTDIVDGALAASSMELMAQSLGLGVLYSGFFTYTVRLSRKLKKKLSLSSGEKIVTTLVLGYPAVKYHRTAPKERPTILFD